MNQTKTGTFIAGCRKEKRMTQAQLAERLNITDRAVSKWETGKSMPDSSVMLELCEILGITVNELLSGERIDMESYEKKADENLIALKRKDENHMAKNVIISALFSTVLLAAVMICIICNIAVSGHLTWSLIPVSSIVFAWVILFPGLILGRRGIILSYVSLSIFTVP
ncbi:MAG: helix-turn-helix domain-containing protein, partial [Lachnospiraceae bacterium]|nr:helix-turn-helix domain-containing protein [Lachnospiraceae bacterium]